MKPMLAKLGIEEDLSRKGYVYELKYDGIRVLVEKKKKIKIINRLYKDIKKKYPEIKLDIICSTCLLDAEIICFNKKKSEFKLVEKREAAKKGYLKLSKKIPSTLIVFDIIKKNGINLRKFGYLERRKILQNVLIENKTVRLSHMVENGKKLWAMVKKKKLEGVIAKKENGKYISGRSKNWLKIVNGKTIDVIIGKNEILKVYSKGKLKKIGKIKNKLKPGTVVEVKYTKYDGKLHKPKILNIRTDKIAKDCILEEQL